MLRTSLFLGLLVSLASHGATQQEIVAEQLRKEIDPRQIVVTLERTTCLGSCPVYRITMKGNGEVEYEGKQFVKVIGVRKGDLPRDEVLKVVNELLRVRFFDAAAEYEVRDEILSSDGKLTLSSIMVTDGPTTFLELRIGEHAKRVRLYDNFPQELGAIPQLIDRTVHVEQWIGSQCGAPNGCLLR